MPTIENPTYTVLKLPEGFLITADLISNPSLALAEIAKLSCKYDPATDIISDTFQVDDLDHVLILSEIRQLQNTILDVFQQFKQFQRFSELQSKLARQPKKG